MANPEHLKVLTGGMTAWRDWRAEAVEVSADLSGAVLVGRDLRGFDLSGCNLCDADISGADLSGANLANAKVLGLRFSRKALRGRVRGVIGVETLVGAPMLRRAIDEALYLDALEQDIARNFPFAWTDNGAAWLRRLWSSAASAAPWRRTLAGWFCAVFGSLNWVTARGGIALGLILTMILQPEVLAPFAAGSRAVPGALAGLVWASLGWVIGGVILSSVIAGWPGRRFFLWLWGAVFDFGRDWYSVVAFAGLCIFVFGAIYATIGADHVVMIEPNGHPLYPWFVAVMGFCTLGVTGMAKAVSGLGMLIMTLNVLAGFVTLGLLIAVIGQNFSNRG